MRNLIVSEFISVEGLTRNNPKSKRQMRFDESERPFAVQIFGGQPERMCVPDGLGGGPGGRAEALFGVVHRSFSWSRRPSEARPRAVLDLTVPGLMPMAAAISGSVRSR